MQNGFYQSRSMREHPILISVPYFIKINDFYEITMTDISEHTNQMAE